MTTRWRWLCFKKSVILLPPFWKNYGQCSEVNAHGQRERTPLTASPLTASPKPDVSLSIIWRHKAACNFLVGANQMNTRLCTYLPSPILVLQCQRIDTELTQIIWSQWLIQEFVVLREAKGKMEGTFCAAFKTFSSTCRDLGNFALFTPKLRALFSKWGHLALTGETWTTPWVSSDCWLSTCLLCQNQGRRSNGSAMRAQTDRGAYERTDWRTDRCCCVTSISLLCVALWLINIL